jgi:hypothetical protein
MATATFAKLDANDMFTGELGNFTGTPPTKGELAPGKGYWVPARKFVTDNSTTAFKVPEKQPPVVDLAVPEVYQETIVRDMTAQEKTAQGTLLRQKIMDDPIRAAQFRVMAKIASTVYGITEQQARQRLFDEILEEYENL